MIDRASWEFDNFGMYPALSVSFALNGADNWSHYAAGGCGLVYNYRIAGRLFTPGEINRYNAGKFSGLDFIALEARALNQAYSAIVVACSILA